MSIVTSRLSTATWYAPLPRLSTKQEQDRAVQQLADDLRALADQPVDPEELADPVRRREPDHEHAVGDLDATQTAAEDRARDQEQRQPGRPEPDRDAAQAAGRRPTRRAR